METTDKKITIDKIIRFFEKKDYVVFAYIFGSFVSRDRYRDIDIGIYSNLANESLLNIEFQIESELEDIINIPTDIRFINNAPLPFIYNVLKNGILFIDNNKFFRADFEGLILKKYFDFMHLRNEYLKEVKHAAV